MLRQAIEEVRRLSVDPRRWGAQSIPKMRDGRIASSDMYVYYGEYGPKSALVATYANPIRLLSVSAALANARALQAYGGLLPMPYSESTIVVAECSEFYLFLSDLCLEHAPVTALPTPGGHASLQMPAVVAHGLGPFLVSLALFAQTMLQIEAEVPESRLPELVNRVWLRVQQIHNDQTVQNASMRVLFRDMDPSINDCFEKHL